MEVWREDMEGLVEERKVIQFDGVDEGEQGWENEGRQCGISVGMEVWRSWWRRGRT